MDDGNGSGCGGIAGIVAVVFLPLTFVTGVLGMNLAGTSRHRAPVGVHACDAVDDRGGDRVGRFLQVEEVDLGKERGGHASGERENSE